MHTIAQNDTTPQDPRSALRTEYMPHWRQLIETLGEHGGRFVAVRQGDKRPYSYDWNKPKNTLSTQQALDRLDKGENIGLAGGAGNLYVPDFDRHAERGYECFQLAGGLHTYRPDAPDRVKFIIECPDPLPTRRSKGDMDLIGWYANGTHAQATIAGVHNKGAPILWSGHNIPVLTADTVAALWLEWTGIPLIAPARESRDTDTICENADLARVADALRHVDPWSVDYGFWIKVIAAVHDEFNGADDALAVMVNWADGHPGEVKVKWKSFDRTYTGKPATLATIFYLATNNGWRGMSMVESSDLRLAKSAPQSSNGFAQPQTAIGVGVGTDHREATAPPHPASEGVWDRFADKPHNTDMGNAQRMYSFAKGRVMYVTAFGKWFAWNGTQWREDDNFAVLSLAKETVRNMYGELTHIEDDSRRKEQLKWIMQSESRGRLESMIALLRSEPGISVPPKELDRHAMLLPVANGTIDLRTGDLLPSDPAHRFTKCLDVSYDPSAECPLWERFLLRIMGGNLELVSFIQRLIGHALTGDATGKYLVFLWGPKGNNGKSTLVETIMRLLGAYALKSPTEMILAKLYGGRIPNDLARLHGVRFTVTNEVDQGMTLSESIVKDLTGKDTLTARFMRGEFFDFEPTHKLWIYGNHKPDIRGTDAGIWDRVKTIPFEVEIPENERDPHFGDKLAQELPGILTWAVWGCLQWQKIGIAAPEIVNQTTGEYKAEQDVLGQFLDDCCDLDRSYTVGSGILYKAYEAWCKEMGHKAESGAKFVSEVTRRGFKAERSANIRSRSGMRLNAHGLQLVGDSPAPHWADKD